MEGRTRGISRTGGGAALRALLAFVLAIGLMPFAPGVAFAGDGGNDFAVSRTVELDGDGDIALRANDALNAAGTGSEIDPYIVDSADALQNAINGAEAGSKIHIRLNGNVSGVGLLNVAEGKAITLDLNGHTLEFAENGNGARNYFQVLKGTLNLVGTGTVKEKTDGAYYAPVMIFGSETDTASYSVVNVGEDVTLEGWSGLFVNGTAGSGSRHAFGVEILLEGAVNSVRDVSGDAGHGIYINGTNQDIEGNVPQITLSDTSRVKSLGNGIYAAGYAVWNLAGNVEAPDALSIKSGDFTITGGKYHSTGAYANPAANGNGSENTGAALSITSNDGYAKRTNVVVTGGEFVSDNGYAVYEGIATKQDGTGAAASSYATLSIRGGKFTGASGRGDLEIATAANKKIVTGGVFSSSTSDEYLAEGYELEYDEASESYVPSVTDPVAVVDGVKYPSLEAAIEAAPLGGTVTLIKDVVLDATGKTNNQGVLTIKKDVVIVGNDHKITAEKVEYQKPNDGGPSMVNIESGANVIIKNLTIDGADENGNAATKHGLNVYEAGEVVVENVTISNNRWYAIVNNASSVDAVHLKTSGNRWGINVEGKLGKASLKLADSVIEEDASVVFENSGTAKNKLTASIESGTYNYLSNKGGSDELDLTISGGKFATDDVEGVLDIADYVADGLEWDPVTGEVKKPAPPVITKPSYDVTVDQPANGTVELSSTTAKEGQKVTVTVKPDEGFELASLVVADEDGNALKLELSADGTYSFEMPAGDVTVHAAFECDGGELCPSHGFTDVDQEQWYHAAIDWAVENRVLNGIGGTTLMMPDGKTTRAEMAQVLWNVEGRPAATEEEAFSDVEEDDWFYGAASWAAQEGIFEGYDGEFDPDGVLTREQAAAVLMRWTEMNGGDVSGRADLSKFPDADSVSGWAVDSVKWAVESGVLQGVESSGVITIDAQGTATRAQIAALMMRLDA